jgi:5-methylcytosine-specific restriction endonuclease McrA
MPDPVYKTITWKTLREKVIKRSGGRCEAAGCTSRGKIVDHIISRRRGGPDHESNLRLLCRDHDNQLKEDASGKRRSGGHAVVHGCDSSGRPIDPSHWWNK